MAEFREEFWISVCTFRSVFQVMFTVCIVFLVMLVAVAFVVDAGTASYYITVISIGIDAALAIATGYIVRTCSKVASTS